MVAVMWPTMRTFPGRKPGETYEMRMRRRDARRRRRAKKASA